MALQVYSASFDGTVRLWDFSGGKLLNTFTVGAPIKSLVSLNNPYRADGSLQTLTSKRMESCTIELTS
jgi:WD40 repeat protein